MTKPVDSNFIKRDVPIALNKAKSVASEYFHEGTNIPNHLVTPQTQQPAKTAVKYTNHAGETFDVTV